MVCVWFFFGGKNCSAWYVREIPILSLWIDRADLFAQGIVYLGQNILTRVLQILHRQVDGWIAWPSLVEEALNPQSLPIAIHQTKKEVSSSYSCTQEISLDLSRISQSLYFTFFYAIHPPQFSLSYLSTKVQLFLGSRNNPSQPTRCSICKPLLAIYLRPHCLEG